MKRKILNIKIEFTDYESLISLIFEKISSREKLTVTYANSHVCISDLKNPLLHQCLEKFDVVHPDGIAVHFANKFLYRTGKDAVRVNGTDLYASIFNSGKKFGCFLLGGPEEGPALLKEKFGGSVNICGFIHSPADSGNHADIINNSGADIIFVALGTPVQEEWIILNRDKINVPVMIAVGSGIDFLSGTKKRAPVAMRKSGFEWLYRLFSEPARLWKRYLIMNPVFMFKVIKQKLKLT